MNYHRDIYGFWHQQDPIEFVYTEEYKKAQSTDVGMSALRVGWLSSVFGHTLKDMNVVDVGAGNGAFVSFGEKIFASIKPYDVVGESISEGELLHTNWDLAVLSDVLEHMPDMTYFLKIPWKYAFLSFPETPQVNKIEELYTWRHFKPHEHLHHLNERGMGRWLRDNGCSTMARSQVEDLLRTRWDPKLPNITSMIIKRAT